MLIACVVAVMSTGFGGPTAAVGKLEVPLTFQVFETYDPMVSMYSGDMAEQAARPIAWSVAREYSIPRYVNSPTLFQMHIQGKQVIVVFGKSSAKEKHVDLMWVDWNGDKTLTDDEATRLIPPIKGKNELPNSEFATFRTFVPVKFPDNEKPFAIQSRNDNWLSLVPAGAMVATLPIGQGVKVAIVDSNMNGIYGEVYNEGNQRSPSDVVMIDRNGNGKFDVMDPSGNVDPTQMEVFPLLRTLQLGKDFYTVQIDATGKSLTAIPYEGPMSTLKLAGGQPELLYYGSKELIFASGVDGAFRVPTIPASIIQIVYTAKDRRGNDWLIGTAENGNTKLLQANKETVYKCGLPLTVALKETHNVNGFSFSLDIKEAGGHQISLLQSKKAQEKPTPQLVISDANGKVLKTLTFKFG